MVSVLNCTKQHLEAPKARRQAPPMPHVIPLKYIATVNPSGGGGGGGGS